MSDQELTAIVCQRGQGEAVSIAGQIFYFRTVGQQTGGVLSVTEIVVSPGCESLAHRHGRTVVLHVEHGEFLVTVGENHYGANAGTSITMLPHQFHQFKNVGSELGRLLIVETPAGDEEFYREVARVVVDRDAPPVPRDEEDLKRMLAVAPRYGLELRP